jgi:hypothetical protein
MTIHERKTARASLYEQEIYWKRELGSEIPLLEIPLGHPRPPVKSFIRAMRTMELDENLYLELKKFFYVRASRYLLGYLLHSKSFYCVT